MSTRLHVNVDHVATIRQQRFTRYPDPVAAASIAELSGAHGITVHLREDRRHIQDRDVRILRETVQTHLNLEMAMTEEMKAIALEVVPDTITLVPERREELTTEGGFDVVSYQDQLPAYIAPFKEAGIRLSMFIDPDPAQVEASHAIGVQVVELSTASYTEAKPADQAAELVRLTEAAALAHKLGLEVAGGHGLDVTNVAAVAAIPHMEELNIGHSIVARAVLIGLERAVREVLELIGSR
jgi:pyridoxine 5-phosphate synthase